MIIFGASGDLTKRKLMPALYSLYREKRLTGEFSILGIGRTVYSDDNYRSYILEELQLFVKSEEQDTALMASFVSHLYYLPMDPAKEEGYPQLRQRLVELTNEVDPDNLLIELAHIRAAAAEMPLSLDDVALFPDLGEIIPVLLNAQELKSLAGRFHGQGMPTLPEITVSGIWTGRDTS